MFYTIKYGRKVVNVYTEVNLEPGVQQSDYHINIFHLHNMQLNSSLHDT